MALHFHDRASAGKLLAYTLQSYVDNPDVVIYALPRGGVVTGAAVAQGLHAPLSLVIARKIGYPGHEEFAIGAVTETGEPMLDQSLIANIDSHWLEQVIKAARQEARRRREKYLQGRAIIPATGRIAIIVDDGVATGHTIRTALSDLRPQSPSKLIVAVPVAPAGVIEQLKQEVDEAVTLDPGYDYLGAVGAYYDDFPQVSDVEVIEILRSHSL